MFRWRQSQDVAVACFAPASGYIEGALRRKRISVRSSWVSNWISSHESFKRISNRKIFSRISNRKSIDIRNLRSISVETPGFEMDKSVYVCIYIPTSPHGASSQILPAPGGLYPEEPDQDSYRAPQEAEAPGAWHSKAQHRQPRRYQPDLQRAITVVRVTVARCGDISIAMIVQSSHYLASSTEHLLL